MRSDRGKVVRQDRLLDKGGYHVPYTFGGHTLGLDVAQLIGMAADPSVQRADGLLQVRVLEVVAPKLVRLLALRKMIKNRGEWRE